MLPAEEVLPMVSFVSFPDQGMGSIIPPLYLITCHLFYCKSFSASSLLHFPNMVLQLGIMVHTHWETQPVRYAYHIKLLTTTRPSTAPFLLKFHADNQDLYFDLPSVYSIIDVTVFQKYHAILNCNKFLLQQ